MKTFSVKGNNQEEIKNFILELYRIYSCDKYNFRFVLHSSLLELYSKQFISENVLMKDIKDIEIHVIEIIAGPTCYRLSAYELNEITIDNDEITVKFNEEKTILIKLTLKKVIIKEKNT